MLDKQTAAEEINRVFETSKNSITPHIGRIALKCEDEDDRTAYYGGDPNDDLDTVIARAVGYVVVIPDGKGYWKINLTDKGQAVMSAGGGKLYDPEKHAKCDYQLAQFYIATPTLVEVTRITGGEHAAVAEYTYKWKATELGAALRNGGIAYSKLSSNQRFDLKYYLAKYSEVHGVNIPVPPEDKVDYGSLIFAKGDNGWHWAPVRKF
jgi:hypothetical protein